MYIQEEGPLDSKYIKLYYKLPESIDYFYISSGHLTVKNSGFKCDNFNWCFVTYMYSNYSFIHEVLPSILLNTENIIDRLFHLFFICCKRPFVLLLIKYIVQTNGSNLLYKPKKGTNNNNPAWIRSRNYVSSNHNGMTDHWYLGKWICIVSSGFTWVNTKCRCFFLWCSDLYILPTDLFSEMTVPIQGQGCVELIKITSNEHEKLQRQWYIQCTL
jgi:hypothetical protein